MDKSGGGIVEETVRILEQIGEEKREDLEDAYGMHFEWMRGTVNKTVRTLCGEFGLGKRDDLVWRSKSIPTAEPSRQIPPIAAAEVVLSDKQQINPSNPEKPSEGIPIQAIVDESDHHVIQDEFQSVKDDYFEVPVIEEPGPIQEETKEEPCALAVEHEPVAAPCHQPQQPQQPQDGEQGKEETSTAILGLNEPASTRRIIAARMMARCKLSTMDRRVQRTLASAVMSARRPHPIVQGGHVSKKATAPLATTLSRKALVNNENSDTIRLVRLSALRKAADNTKGMVSESLKKANKRVALASLDANQVSIQHTEPKANDKAEKPPDTKGHETVPTEVALKASPMNKTEDMLETQDISQPKIIEAPVEAVAESSQVDDSMDHTSTIVGPLAEAAIIIEAPATVENDEDGFTDALGDPRISVMDIDPRMSRIDCTGDKNKPSQVIQIDEEQLDSQAAPLSLRQMVDSMKTPTVAVEPSSRTSRRRNIVQEPLLRQQVEAEAVSKPSRSTRSRAKIEGPETISADAKNEEVPKDLHNQLAGDDTPKLAQVTRKKRLDPVVLAAIEDKVAFVDEPQNEAGTVLRRSRRQVSHAVDIVQSTKSNPVNEAPLSVAAHESRKKPFSEEAAALFKGAVSNAASHKVAEPEHVEALPLGTANRRSRRQASAEQGVAHEQQDASSDLATKVPELNNTEVPLVIMNRRSRTRALEEDHVPAAFSTEPVSDGTNAEQEANHNHVSPITAVRSSSRKALELNQGSTLPNAIEKSEVPTATANRRSRRKVAEESSSHGNTAVASGSSENAQGSENQANHGTDLAESKDGVEAVQATAVRRSRRAAVDAIAQKCSKSSKHKRIETMQTSHEDTAVVEAKETQAKEPQWIELQKPEDETSAIITRKSRRRVRKAEDDAPLANSGVSLQLEDDAGEGTRRCKRARKQDATNHDKEHAASDVVHDLDIHLEQKDAAAIDEAEEIIVVAKKSRGQKPKKQEIQKVQEAEADARRPRRKAATKEDGPAVLLEDSSAVQKEPQPEGNEVACLNDDQPSVQPLGEEGEHDHPSVVEECAQKVQLPEPKSKVEVELEVELEVEVAVELEEHAGHDETISTKPEAIRDASELNATESHAVIAPKARGRKKPGRNVEASDPVERKPQLIIDTAMEVDRHSVDLVGQDPVAPVICKEPVQLSVITEQIDSCQPIANSVVHMSEEDHTAQNQPSSPKIFKRGNRRIKITGMTSKPEGAITKPKSSTQSKNVASEENVEQSKEAIAERIESETATLEPAKSKVVESEPAANEHSRVISVTNARDCDAVVADLGSAKPDDCPTDSSVKESVPGSKGSSSISGIERSISECMKDKVSLVTPQLLDLTTETFTVDRNGRVDDAAIRKMLDSAKQASPASDDGVVASGKPEPHDAAAGKRRKIFKPTKNIYKAGKAKSIRENSASPKVSVIAKDILVTNEKGCDEERSHNPEKLDAELPLATSPNNMATLERAALITAEHEQIVQDGKQQDLSEPCDPIAHQKLSYSKVLRETESTVVESIPDTHARLIEEIEPEIVESVLVPLEEHQTDLPVPIYNATDTFSMSLPSEPAPGSSSLDDEKPRAHSMDEEPANPLDSSIALDTSVVFASSTEGSTKPSLTPKTDKLNRMEGLRSRIAKLRSTSKKSEPEVLKQRLPGHLRKLQAGQGLEESRVSTETPDVVEGLQPNATTSRPPSSGTHKSMVTFSDISSKPVRLLSTSKHSSESIDKPAAMIKFIEDVAAKSDMPMDIVEPTSVQVSEPDVVPEQTKLPDAQPPESPVPCSSVLNISQVSTDAETNSLAPLQKEVLSPAKESLENAPLETERFTKSPSVREEAQQQQLSSSMEVDIVEELNPTHLAANGSDSNFSSDPAPTLRTQPLSNMIAPGSSSFMGNIVTSISSFLPTFNRKAAMVVEEDLDELNRKKQIQIDAERERREKMLEAKRKEAVIMKQKELDEKQKRAEQRRKMLLDIEKQREAERIAKEEERLRKIKEAEQRKKRMRDEEEAKREEKRKRIEENQKKLAMEREKKTLELEVRVVPTGPLGQKPTVKALEAALNTSVTSSSSSPSMGSSAVASGSGSGSGPLNFFADKASTANSKSAVASVTSSSSGSSLAFAPNTIAKTASLVATTKVFSSPNSHTAFIASIVPSAVVTSKADTELMPPPPPREPKTPLAKSGVPAEDPAAASYQMTAERNDDTDDEDSNDEEEGSGHRKKKKIPAWARGVQLQQALIQQLKVDPDQIFPRMYTCNLEEVFVDHGEKKKRYRTRTSSGNWVRDRLTWKEEMEYKKAMGML